MAEHDTKTPTNHVAVRLDPEDLARLDALRARMRMPSHQATQSDVLRAAIRKGIEALEHELPPAG
jgi:predicted DNA-binding protein